MTHPIDESPPMSVPEQAAEWLLRWHCGDLSIAERFEYLQWLKTSPVHIAETLRMCRLYSWLENTKLKLFLTYEGGFSNVVELAPSDPFEAELARAARSYPIDTETLVREAREALGRQRTRRAVAAAAIAAVALLSLSFLRVIMPGTGMETEAGEWRTVSLQDGSKVVLGPYSHLRLEYDEDNRVIALESGEARVKVSKDRRPFLVRTPLLTARAVGTDFGVSVAPGGTAVTVTVAEGRVAVSPNDRPAETLYVAASEQVKVENDRPVVAKRVDAGRELSWADGSLIFTAGDTLGRAAEEFNRRNVVQIRVDQALAELPVRGRFDASDPVAFAQAIGTRSDAVLTRTEKTVRIELKERPPGQDRGARDDR